MPASPLGVWVRARSEADARVHKAEREEVADAAKPPRLSRRQNAVFWVALVLILVAGFALGSG